MATKITYNGKETTVEDGKSVKLCCKGKKLLEAISMLFSGKGYITYNGKTTEIEAGKTAVIADKETPMISDIVVADGYNHNAPELHPKGIIPEGATYTIAETRETLVGGDAFPETVSRGDQYIYGDYVYSYWFNSPVYSNDGWYVVGVTDGTKTRYGAILESISGISVTMMYFTFEDCTSLVEAPVIPDSITDMWWAFAYCTSLVSAPVIPDGVMDIEGTFVDCTSLVSAPVIPDSVMDMEGTFEGCTSLVSAPVIPDGVTSMNYTFQGCTSLVSAPVIPDGVTKMNRTFRGCRSLENAPVIPDKVTDMSDTFSGCSSLSGSITINATPEIYTMCLYGTQITEILGDCQIKEKILATRY